MHQRCAANDVCVFRRHILGARSADEQDLVSRLRLAEHRTGAAQRAAAARLAFAGLLSERLASEVILSEDLIDDIAELVGALHSRLAAQPDLPPAPATPMTPMPVRVCNTVDMPSTLVYDFHKFVACEGNNHSTTNLHLTKQVLFECSLCRLIPQVSLARQCQNRWHFRRTHNMAWECYFAMARRYDTTCQTITADFDARKAAAWRIIGVLS